MTRYQFNVAALTFECQFPDGIDIQKFLFFYRPFYNKDLVDNPCFILSAIDDKPSFDESSPLESFSNDLGDVNVYNYCDGYAITFSYCESGSVFYLLSDKLFTSIQAYIIWDDPYAATALTSMLRVSFSQNVLLHDGISIHSSVVANNGYGYLFLGKSGTGKSTHTRLWLNYIPGSSLLNDDNPILRFIGGGLYVFGSPWSGKTHCYKNESVPVRSIVRLQQYPENRFQRVSGVFAWTELFPSCASLKYCSELYQKSIEMCNRIVSSVCVGHLKCLPDREAAQICAMNVRQLVD